MARVQAQQLELVAGLEKEVWSVMTSDLSY